jgi:uncharacterized protein (DUF1684 family)
MRKLHQSLEFMFKNKFLKWGIGLVFAMAAIYSLTMSQQDYNAEIVDVRNEYRDNMLEIENSPVENIKGFSNFRYFDPKEEWKLFVDFESSPSEQTFPMTMTDQSVESIKMVGYAVISLNNKEYKLMLFDEGDHYLLPFTDDTNGEETYGGGRYINVPKTSNNKLLVDFNMAHNFYCVYNLNFVCPVPPSENDIDFRIDAGEKVLFLD